MIRSTVSLCRRWLALMTLGSVALGASAQGNSHLNVPPTQIVYSNFAPVSGLPQNQFFTSGFTRPDGTQDVLGVSTLQRQSLVYTDFMLVLYRKPSSQLMVAESGEVYLADFDAAYKGKPLQDQWPLVHYTIPANEGRIVVHVTLGAGRAYGGTRQPALVHYINPNVEMNARALGYLAAN